MVTKDRDFEEDREMQALATEVDADQEALDQDQDVAPAAQYVTVEQYQRIEQALESTTRQINGLQGKIDSGLNAIRRDTEAQRTQTAAEAQWRAWEGKIDALPEDAQEGARMTLEMLKAQASRGVQELRPAPQATQSAALEEVYQFVRDSRVDPHAAGLNYAVLFDQTLSESDRRTRFMDSLHAVRLAQIKPETPDAPARPVPKAENPPVQGNRSGGGYRNIDDLRGAFVEGRLDKEGFLSEAKKMGFPEG